MALANAWLSLRVNSGRRGEGGGMQSKNFEFLRPYWEELAHLGASAEQYANPDPQGAVSKLRTYGDQITLFIYHHHGLPKPCQANLNDLLSSASFIQAAPFVNVSKLHMLRNVISQFQPIKKGASKA